MHVLQMGSLKTWQLTGIVLMISGVFAKFVAVITIIPDPVIGSAMAIGLGMVSHSRITYIYIYIYIYIK